MVRMAHTSNFYAICLEFLTNTRFFCKMTMSNTLKNAALGQNKNPVGCLRSKKHVFNTSRNIFDPHGT